MISCAHASSSPDLRSDKMSNFVPINQTSPDTLDAGDGAWASQPNCFLPAVGSKRKKSQTTGSTRKKKTFDSSKANLVPGSPRTKQHSNTISRSLKVSKPIKPRIANSCEETSVTDTTVGPGPSSIDSNGTCMLEPNIELLSIASATGAHYHERNIGAMPDKAMYHADEPLSLTSPSPSSLISPYAGSSSTSKSDAFLSSDPIDLSPSKFCNIEVVAKDQFAISSSGLNEYDEQQIRNLSQTDRAFEDDLATLNLELTQNGSFLALEKPEMNLSSSVKTFPLNSPEFLIHEDSALISSDMMFSGEDPVGHPKQSFDDDDFPIDDEWIEETLKLAEPKQEYGNVIFRPAHESSPCLADDNRSLDWLDNPPPPSKQVFKDRKALHPIAMTSLNSVSSSSSISKTIPTQCPSHTELDDNGPFTPWEENFLDEDEDEYDLNQVPGGMAPPLSTKEPSSLPRHVNKSPQSISQEPRPSIRCIQITPPSTSLETGIPHQVSFNVSGQPLPFIRPPFPAPILDRSPIQGLNSRTVLRTCFRIGEALNAATASLHSVGALDVVIELYCRSLSSVRHPTSLKQTFQFGDLFSPTSPPFLTGTYMTWKGIGLWDHDSRAFLGEHGKGKMARAVGKIKILEKEDGLKRWEMVVMSIWEVDWEDVGVAKGIVLA